jgi:hypothetical protein
MAKQGASRYVWRSPVAYNRYMIAIVHEHGVRGRPVDAGIALDSLGAMGKGQIVQPYCFALVNVGMASGDPAWDPIR